MGTLSDTLRNQILDAIGNNVALQVAQVYVKLHTGDPGSAGTANAAANTTRQAASFGAASAQAMTNDADVVWTNVPNAETYSWISLWDASSGGNFLGKDDLASAQAVAVGNNFRIPAGSLSVSA